MSQIYDTIIIGSGPSGLTAGIYTSRANLKTAIIAGEIWGGQLMLTTDVENFPGFPEGIQGPQLMEAMRQQSTRFSADWIAKNVTKVDFSSSPFKVMTGLPTESSAKEGELSTLNSQFSTHRAHSIIIATGAETQWLGVPGEQQLIGRGVSSCAPCDAAFFRNKRVYVVGGGDAAMEEALVLTKFASEVTVIHRRDQFKASQIMGQRVLDHPKIKVFWDTEVTEFHGGQKLESVTLQTTTKRWGQDGDWMLERGRGIVGAGLVSAQAAESQLDSSESSDTGTNTRPTPTKSGEYIQWTSSIDGVFVAIGHHPATDIFKGHIELDKKGYILKQSEVRSQKSEVNKYPSLTSIDGVFVSGDVHDYHYRQAVTAAAFGCMAAMDVEKWMADNGLAAVSASAKW